MSGIKKLASETLWYGGSTIVARLLNYLLTPLLTYNLTNISDYGKIGLIYSLIPIFNVLFTYGFETAYFKFASNKDLNKNLYHTASISILVSTLLLSLVLWSSKQLIGTSIGLQDYPEIIKLVILIIAIDTLSAIPFAKLRQDGRPIKYASAKIVGIITNIALTIFYIKICPFYYQKYTWLQYVYSPLTNQAYYVVLANLVQSVITLLFLSKEVLQLRCRFDKVLWKQMMLYAAPLILVGMGGVINDTMNRVMLRWWLPGTVEYREAQIGIFNACAKLAILITLFIQAFKMSAEPFFFKQAAASNAPRLYARVMKFFVIILSFAFLSVSLYLNIWQHFIGAKYRDGLTIVPILLMANIFLGIYYNLTVWYKLTNKTIYGAWITLFGSAISVIFNYIFIPSYGLVACAWSTLLVYAVMLYLSYYYGQKYYRIPYAWKKLSIYLSLVVAIYFIHKGLTNIWSNHYFSLAVATLLMAIYAKFISVIEYKEFVKLPLIGKYFTKPN